MTAALTVQRDHTSWHLRLNRPAKRNALSAELVDALHEALDAAHAEGATLITLQGEGRNFSAGFDFTDYEQESEGDLLLRFVRIELLLQKLAQSPALTVALAHGKNFGAGVDLIAACRWRLGAPDSLYRMPGLRFGLVLGSRRFAQRVGIEKAREILEQARPFQADEALQMGFLRAIATPDDWPQALAEARDASLSLAGPTRVALYQAVESEDPHGDLSRLTRSAAAPGIKARIAEYLAA